MIKPPDLLVYMDPQKIAEQLKKIKELKQARKGQTRVSFFQRYMSQQVPKLGTWKNRNVLPGQQVQRIQQRPSAWKTSYQPPFTSDRWQQNFDSRQQARQKVFNINRTMPEIRRLKYALKARQMKLAQKEQEQQLKHQQISQRERLANIRQQQITQQERLTGTRQQQIDQRDRLVDMRQQQIDQRDRLVDMRQQQIINREKADQKMRRKFTKVQYKQKERQKTMGDAIKKNLSKRTQQLNKRTQQLNIGQSIIEEKLQNIANQQNQAKQVFNRLQQEEIRSKARQQELKALQDHIRMEHQRIFQQQQTLADRRNRIKYDEDRIKQLEMNVNYRQRQLSQQKTMFLNQANMSSEQRIIEQREIQREKAKIIQQKLAVQRAKQQIRKEQLLIIEQYNQLAKTNIDPQILPRKRGLKQTAQQRRERLIKRQKLRNSHNTYTPIRPSMLVQQGNSSIVINQAGDDDNLVYIGQKVDRNIGQIQYFTRKYIRIARNELNLIPEMFDVAKKHQQVDIPFPTTHVMLRKDIYKGITYYTLRHYIYYNKSPFLTRNGFNLTQDQMQMLVDNIKGITLSDVIQ